MDIWSEIQTIAVVILVLSATALCLILAIGLALVLPRIRRIAGNLEQTTQSSAETAASVAVIAHSFAERSDAIAENLAQTSQNFNAASADSAEAMKNIANASALLGPAGTLASWGNVIRGQWPAIANFIRRVVQEEGGLDAVNNPRFRNAVQSVLGLFRRSQ